MIRLTRRETWLAVGLGLFVVAWATYAFGISPALERIETLKRVIPEKESELKQIRARAGKYVALRDGIEGLRDRISSQDQTFELLPFLESLVKECGLTENRKIMKQQPLQLGTDYRETIVEVKMERLTQPQLLDFLLKLQSSDVMATIKTLQIKKNLKDPGLLDSDLEISNLKLTQG